MVHIIFLFLIKFYSIIYLLLSISVIQFNFISSIFDHLHLGDGYGGNSNGYHVHQQYNTTPYWGSYMSGYNTPTNYNMAPGKVNYIELNHIALN